MISVPIPKVKEIEFQRKLYKNYKIEIPIIPWENKSFARFLISYTILLKI